MVPPLNTRWTWLQAHSAPWIPGSWGRCTQLTDGAKPRKRPRRQERLLLLHVAGQSLHTGALKEAGFFWAASVKETLSASHHSSPRMRKQQQTLWPSELLVPCCSLGCHTWNCTRKLATYLSRPSRSPDFLQRPLNPTLVHVDTSTQGSTSDF